MRGALQRGLTGLLIRCGASAAGLSLLLISCQSIAQVGTSIGVATGQINESQAQSINESAAAVERSYQDFTPEQEYYLGRTVAAIILQKYKPYDDPKANYYINELGQSLAMASVRPETFSGYHFLIVDSNDINALSAPSGFIFVTRGLLRCAQDEDELAAILAHEITHVALKHGLQAIKKSRVTSALSSVALTGAMLAGSPEVQQLTQTFGESVKDITSTLINNGYSRQFEEQADAGAVKILERVGYDPWALVDVLKVMETRLKPGGLDFAKTHPAPEVRIKAVEKVLGDWPNVPSSNQTREQRFEAALAGV